MRRYQWFLLLSEALAIVSPCANGTTTARHAWSRSTRLLASVLRPLARFQAQTIINYTFESVWSSRHSFRYSAMAESDSSAGRYVADRTETATATSLAVTSEYALSKTRSSVVWSFAVHAPPNLEPCAFSV